MARSKSAPSPAAAAAAAPRKSAGLKAPKSATKKPAAAAAAAPAVVVVVAAEGKRKLKRAREEDEAAPAAAAAADKPKRKITHKARMRALRRRDEREALAASGRGYENQKKRTEAEVRPGQWKDIATTLGSAFQLEVKPRISAKSAVLQGHLALEWSAARLADANARKLGEFVRHRAPLKPDEDADDKDMTAYAEKLGVYDAANAAYAAARVGSRIQGRHMDASVRDALFQQGGIAALQRFEELLVFQGADDQAKDEKAAQRAKEQDVRDARAIVITSLTALGTKRDLTDAEALELRTAHHDTHLDAHRTQVALVAKYERIIANGQKEAAEVAGAGAKKAAKVIEELGKVTIPDTEQAIADAARALKDADVAYESFRADHAAPIFEILKKDRTPAQNTLVKELETKERAKVRARRELHELEQKLAGQKERLKRKEEALPKRDDLVAKIEARIAKNEAKLEAARVAEKAAKALLTKDYAAASKQKKNGGKAAAAAAAAAAASAESSSDEEEEESDDMDESDE